MIKRLSRKFREDNDTGFGSSATTQGSRLVNADGSFNVKRTGLPFTYRFNHFHNLITMKWWKFNLIVLMVYIAANCLFATAYFLTGVEQLGGMMSEGIKDKWIEAFYFSCQTFTTVGYGRVNPVGHAAGLIASFESLIGLMSFALATGLLYGRFSRPRATLLFSEKALISPYKNITALMFRIANARKNQLIECEAQLLMSLAETENGRSLRRFYPLNLERNKVTGLAMSWTIVHPIDDESPLKGWGEKDFKEAGIEFIFIFKAFDDTYSQTVHTRYSYRHEEIYWGAKFVPMYHQSADHQSTILEMDKLGLFEEVSLPEGSNPTPLPRQVSQ